MAQQDLSPAETMELFGVGATAQPLCSLTLIGDCNVFTRTVYEHVLDTTPPTRVPAASTTDVTTPTGTFAVFWTASTQSESQVACIDGPRIANDTGIAVTLSYDSLAKSEPPSS